MNDHRRIDVPEQDIKRFERPARKPPQLERAVRPLELWLVFIVVAVSWFAAGAVWMDTFN